MAEYIEREAAIRTALISDCEDVSLNDVIKVTEEVAEAIKRIPTADVAPVRHGKWTVYDMYEYKLADRTTAYEPVFACSVCGMHTESYVREDYPQMPEDADFPKYCPNCGARMDGES